MREKGREGKQFLEILVTVLPEAQIFRCYVTPASITENLLLSRSDSAMFSLLQP